MPEVLVPVTPADDAVALVEPVAPRPPAPPARPSVPRKTAREAWADWRATSSAAAGDCFCESVSSWLEGASAQLVRPLWPKGGVRPTLMDVQAKLRHGLSLALPHETDYVEGLAAARLHVEKELARARARDRAAG